MTPKFDRLIESFASSHGPGRPFTPNLSEEEEHAILLRLHKRDRELLDSDGDPLPAQELIKQLTGHTIDPSAALKRIWGPSGMVVRHAQWIRRNKLNIPRRPRRKRPHNRSRLPLPPFDGPDIPLPPNAPRPPGTS